MCPKWDTVQAVIRLLLICLLFGWIFVAHCYSGTIYSGIAWRNGDLFNSSLIVNGYAKRPFLSGIGGKSIAIINISRQENLLRPIVEFVFVQVRNTNNNLIRAILGNRFYSRMIPVALDHSRPLLGHQGVDNVSRCFMNYCIRPAGRHVAAITQKELYRFLV